MELRKPLALAALALLLASSAAYSTPPQAAAAHQPDPQQQLGAHAPLSGGARSACLAPADPGDARCAGEDPLEPRWAWDQAARACRHFAYYGCGGNSNNFAGEAECLAACGGGAASGGCDCGGAARQPVCARVPRDAEDPSAGERARTFESPCHARCAGGRVEHAGPCIAVMPRGAPNPAVMHRSLQQNQSPGCICTKEFRPVCADGQDFSNPCTAKCAGHTTYTPGRCGTSPASPGPSPAATKPQPAAGAEPALTPLGNAAVVANGPRPISSAGAAGSSGPFLLNAPTLTPLGNAAAITNRPRPISGAGAAGSNGPFLLSPGTPPAKPAAAKPIPAKPAPAKPASPAAPAAEPSAAQVGSVRPKADTVEERDESKAPAGSPCICPKIWRPVCEKAAGAAAAVGAARRQFGNACEARCANATAFDEGPCPSAPIETPSKPAEASPINPLDCVCTADYRPVCGADSKTYSNACMASCALVKVAHDGPCGGGADGGKEQGAPAQPPACACPKIFKPVCGADGKTYGNDCLAECAKTTVKAQGECGKAAAPQTGAPAQPPACACPKIFKPVCGADGKTYGNACLAECAKTAIAAQGECAGAGTKAAGSVPAACKCGREYSPLCGLDGKTYTNPCAAKCANATQAYPGPCKAACAACPKTVKPYCAMSRGYGARTFASCCFAKCNGLSSIADVLHEGPCKPGACTDGCAKQPRSPVCCGGRSYANACLAACHGAAGCKPGGCPPTLYQLTSGATCLLGSCPVTCGDGDEYQPVCAVTAAGKKEMDRCKAVCDPLAAVISAGKCKA